VAGEQPAAFENTARLPVEQVEFDLHLSADRRLVVIHDATLDRMTDGTGPVAGLDWASLSRLTIRGTGGQRLLSFEEAIEIFRPTGIGLRIELKPGLGRTPYRGLAAAVRDTLRHMGMVDRSTVTSFQLESLGEVGDTLPRVWLVTPDLQSDIGIAGVCALAKSAAVPALGLRSNRVDAPIIAEVRKTGLGAGAWAVNDSGTIARMFDLSVDVFTTDRPDLALALRDRRGGK